MVGKRKRVVIVTSGQPSANPRVVKEATALNDAGFNVSVVYAPLSPWADEFDEMLFASTPGINWLRAGAHPVLQPRRYKYVRARRKLYESVYSKAPGLIGAKENAFVLYGQDLKRTASSIPADVFIAHNLGALPAAVFAAKKWIARAAFDAEDFHRGETNTGSTSFRLTRELENKYFPQVSYISTASPLITSTYQKLFANQVFFTLNNVFSKKYLQHVHENATGQLRIFWFSQTVGANRGLEIIVDALNSLPELDISLHMLGECSPAYKRELLSRSDKPRQLNFLPATSLENIFKQAGCFDIGLASEVPYCENRNICLTNKLFTYLLSSNCLLASDTAAQQQFISTYRTTGLLYKHNDAKDLADKLRLLYFDRQLLMRFKNGAHDIAEFVLNWEKESEILIEKVSSLMPGY